MVWKRSRRALHGKSCESIVGKEIGDEGIIPYCNNCDISLWDMFTTSIIAAVVNEYGEVALLIYKISSKRKVYGKKSGL